MEEQCNNVSDSQRYIHTLVHIVLGTELLITPYESCYLKHELQPRVEICHYTWAEHFDAVCQVRDRYASFEYPTAAAAGPALRGAMAVQFKLSDNPSQIPVDRRLHANISGYDSDRNIDEIFSSSFELR